MSDLISIVLPVYNGEKYLRESIESVIQQTYKNWELLILDDCSTDSTPTIAMEYASNDPRIKYNRNKNNLKLPGNLNRGFSLAKGDFLTWTSDDNKFRPNALEKMHAKLVSSSSDLVYASYQAFDDDGNKRVVFADFDGKNHILGSNVVGACFMYTRKAYETVGDYDKNLFLVEDFDYWQRMISKFNPVVISDVLYDYRVHSASLTSTKKECEYGQRLQLMLEKNRKLYGKLDLEASYFYYMCLKKAYDCQSKEYIFENKFKRINFAYKMKNLPRKVILHFKRKS